MCGVLVFDAFLCTSSLRIGHLIECHAIVVLVRLECELVVCYASRRVE